MNAFHQFLATSAVDVIEGFDRDAALEAGIPEKKVRDWATLHTVYFGPATSPQKQRLARDRARRSGFSLEQLAMIERELNDVNHKRARDKLRLLVLEFHGTYKQLMALVKKQIPKVNATPKKRISFSKSRGKMRTMTITEDEHLIAEIEHAVTHGLDPSKPATPQLLAKFLAIIRGDDGGVPASAPRPIVVVPLDEHLKILRGEGDDVLLGLTDGTTITGAEYLGLIASAELEVATFHPQDGPVNLYRTERFANQKQRDLVRATTPVCPVPGCRHGADSCQIHHITAWKHGGETNLANLAPLCRYHNGTNDDDPRVARRGRIERVAGAPVWTSPRGYRVHNPYHHHYGAMQQLFSSR